ncbi:MAG: ATP-binding protein [Bacteroidota bacterium]
MKDLIGREPEIEVLNRIFTSKKSEFLAIYGRRRVGKTFLIREYFDYAFDFQLTGLANASMAQQLLNFQTAMRRSFPAYTGNIPSNWFEAFQELVIQLEQIQENRKKTIFLDELPWLATSRSDFLTALEHFWNSWATTRKDILLITCGSAASWMIHQLLHNKGGLHNRVTERVNMFPFTLRETELMLKAKHSVFNRYQILQLYMVMGGIPFYLDAIDPQKSAAQNIDMLCFQKGALLREEFPHLFSSLYKNSHRHEAIVTALASKTKGLTRYELSKATGISSGGTMSQLLSELEASGFISKYKNFHKKRRQALYRLSDFYSSFFLRFLRGESHFEENTGMNSLDHPTQRAWTGYAFEQVCLSHIPQIKQALGIKGVASASSSWKSERKKKGAQIDLVIDRRDQVINLCEIKFSIHPFTISRSYAEQLRNKIGVFKQETQTRKAVYLTFITSYGVDKNAYAQSLVHSEVTMDALFT